MIRSRGPLQHHGHRLDDGLLAEALGMTLPGIAGTPAPDSRLLEARPRDRPAGRRDGRRGAAARAAS